MPFRSGTLSIILLAELLCKHYLGFQQPTQKAAEERPVGTLGGTRDFDGERPRDALRRGRWNYDDADDAGMAG
jgi:hypothetical protein